MLLVLRSWQFGISIWKKDVDIFIVGFMLYDNQRSEFELIYVQLVLLLVLEVFSFVEFNIFKKKINFLFFDYLVMIVMKNLEVLQEVLGEQVIGRCR